MTCLKFVKYGVEKKIEGFCGVCGFFLRMKPISFWQSETGPAHIGICTNAKSGHYRHALDQEHPQCREAG